MCASLASSIWVMTTEEAGTAVEVVAPAKVVKEIRVKRTAKPDRVALDEKVGQLQSAIDQSQQRITELKGLIDGKKDSRRHVGGSGAPARAKLGELRAAFKSVVVRSPCHTWDGSYT